METCPTDVLTLICEEACHDDFGRTARSLGLVSKIFHTIAEPIELRTVRVFGINQLRNVIARLERTKYGYESYGTWVQHLLISEITAEHALDVDTNYGNDMRGDDLRESFWRTDTAAKAAASYQRHSDEFWRMASSLVRRSSSSLKTLYLLAFDNWICWDPYRSRPSEPEVPSPKVLGALSGTTFPNLVSLMVNHQAFSDLNWFHRNEKPFVVPKSPTLRRLYIRSPLVEASFHPSGHEASFSHVHPLLELLRLDTNNITHLTVWPDWMRSPDEAIRQIFGDDADVLLRNKTLPKALRSVVLHQGISDIHYCGTGALQAYERNRAFVQSVEELGIHGLEACLPIPTYPKKGEREFELIMSRWESDVLDDYI